MSLTAMILAGTWRLQRQELNTYAHSNHYLVLLKKSKSCAEFRDSIYGQQAIFV
ncbi:MAG: hypothetical protein WA118_10545 [Carboxydocellales bacterium]